HVDPNSAPAKESCCDQSGSAPAERVEDEVARVRAELNDSLQQEKRLLRGISDALLRLRVEIRNVPGVAQRNALLCTVGDRYAVLMAGIDRFSEVVSLSALKNLVDVGRRGVVIKELVEDELFRH